MDVHEDEAPPREARAWAAGGREDQQPPLLARAARHELLEREVGGQPPGARRLLGLRGGAELQAQRPELLVLPLVPDDVGPQRLRQADLLAARLGLNAAHRGRVLLPYSDVCVLELPALGDLRVELGRAALRDAPGPL